VSVPDQGSIELVDLIADYQVDPDTFDPVSPIASVQALLDLKAPIASPTFTGTVSGITKTMVGLGNADNTSDANKPVSTATQTALDLKQDLSAKGEVSGYAGINASGNVEDAAGVELLNVEAANAAYLQLAADAEDDVTTASRRVIFIDPVDGSARGGLVYIEHYGDGTNSDVPDQAYGLDIHNWPGAQQGVVVHQYSSNGPAVQIDNTDSDTAFRIKNAINLDNNPGSPGGGTGDYVQFRSVDNVTRFVVRDAGAVAVVLRSDEITYPGLWITNPAAVRGIRVQQSGAQTAVSIEAAAGATGYYPLDVTGYNYGPRFTTSQNGQKTLTVQKDGTGNGDALYIVNKGTGSAILINDGTTNNWLIDKAGVINWSAAALSAAAATAGAATLPSNPVGFIVAKVGGVTAKIPYYAA
jgi:hypothetical protein